MGHIVAARIGLYVHSGIEKESFRLANQEEYRLIISSPPNRMFPTIPTITETYILQENPSLITPKLELFYTIVDPKGQILFFGTEQKPGCLRVVATNFPNASIYFDDINPRKIIINPNTKLGAYVEYSHFSKRLRLAVYYSNKNTPAVNWTDLLHFRH